MVNIKRSIPGCITPIAVVPNDRHLSSKTGGRAFGHGLRFFLVLVSFLPTSTGMTAAPPIALRSILLLGRCNASSSAPLAANPMVKSTLTALSRKSLSTRSKSSATMHSRPCTCHSLSAQSPTLNSARLQKFRTLASLSATSQSKAQVS